MSLQLAIARAAQISPTKTAIRGPGLDRSWAETADRVARIAGGLLALGLKPGDRFAVLGQNSPEYLELVYGAAWAGLVIVPLNHRLSIPEIANILADSGARALAHDLAHAPAASTLVAGGGVRLLSLSAIEEDFARLLTTAPIPPSTGAPTDLYGLCYTGGTTGQPKGVEISQVAMHLTALDQISGMEISSDDVFLVAPPLFHMAGLSTTNSVTYQHGTHVFSDDLSPAGILAAIEAHGVNFLSLVPTVYQALIAAAGSDSAALHRITNLVYGAAPATEALLGDLLTAFPNARIKQAYGQTEIAGACAFLPPEVHRPGDPRLACAGRAAPSVHLRIVDAQGAEVPVGTAGEITVAGPRVMRGYWNMPDQTAAAIVDGWLHTGDVGVMDGEGYIRIVDRLKDMIVSGGENVFCGEVEAVLARHPDVAEAAVIGVPDAHWGEAVHAFIVPSGPTLPEPDAVVVHARGALGGYKVPKGITFIKSLPLSAVGKVNKAELRKIWQDAARDRPASVTPVS